MAQAEPHHFLARRIGLGTAIAVLVGSTIGSGIFRTPAGIAEKLPGPVPMLLCWVFGGLLALCGALTLAEIGGAHPETGGLYAFIRDEFGRRAAFVFGWSQLVMIRPASVAAVSMAFSEYALRAAGHKTPEGDMAPYFVAAGAVLLVSIINYLGVLVGGVVQDLTTLLKVLGLMIIVVLALSIALPQSGGHFSPPMPEGSFGVSAFALALISVLWAYDGWADVSYVAGEVKDPRKNLPRALILGTLGVIVVYLLANVAYLSVFSIDKIKSSQLVAADVAEVLMGGWGVLFVSITVMISTFGTLNGTMMTSPRIFFAMADDKLFFRPVASVSDRFGTPGVAIWLTCFLGVIFVFVARKFESLADIFVTAMIPFYALAIGGIFALRKQSDYNPSVRTPLYPLTPILFIAAMLFILGNSLYEETNQMLEKGFVEGGKATYGVLLAALAGIPVYHLTFGRKANSTGL
jgi:amino acid transporter